MKKILPLCLLVLPFAGCAAGTVSASNIKPATDNIRERHDAYVNADINLSQAAKEQYLRETQWLSDALVEATTK